MTDQPDPGDGHVHRTTLTSRPYGLAVVASNDWVATTVVGATGHHIEEKPESFTATRRL